MANGILRQKSKKHLFSTWKMGAICILLIVCMAMVSCSIPRQYESISIENRDSVTEAIRTAMKNRSWRAVIRFKARSDSQEQIGKLVDGLVEDALYESEDPCGGDYLRFQSGGYEIRHSIKRGWLRNDYTVELYPDCYTTAEQEEAVDERVREIVDGFGFDEGTPEIEKVRAVRDFIYDTVGYDTVHKDNGHSHMKTTAYAALFYHTAVCQGYAVLCYRLLKELGVDARIVTGKAKTGDAYERHAWNIVRVDGNYFNMDITMDKAAETDDYFLKSDAAFAADHQRDAEYRSKEFSRQYPMAEGDYRW